MKVHIECRVVATPIRVSVAYETAYERGSSELDLVDFGYEEDEKDIIDDDWEQLIQEGIEYYAVLYNPKKHNGSLYPEDPLYQKTEED